VDGFVYGGMNRITEKKDDVTSKGINVSVVLNRLGIGSLCTGFMYEQNGGMALEVLDEEGIPHDYVWQPGSIRINTKVLDTKTSIITEINDKGVPAGEEYITALKEKVLSHARAGDTIVTIGSMPPGCPLTLFAELIAEAGKKGIRCVLDAEGEILKKGVAAHPFFVKINRFELETLTGKSIKSDAEIVTECEKIIDSGVKLIAVSLGAEGAVISDGKKAFKAEAMRIKPKSPTGAGDSMLAGILAASIKNCPLDELLKNGASAATATVLCEGTELMTRELFDSILNDVVIHKLR